MVRLTSPVARSQVAAGLTNRTALPSSRVKLSGVLSIRFTRMAPAGRVPSVTGPVL